MITRSDALNDALERLRDYCYLDAPGFASHGPMGAETLSHLGHDDLVADWVESYRQRYDPLTPPPAKDRLTGRDENALRSALGDAARISDWATMFREELWNRPWQDVVTQWAPSLLAGYGGALTHGLIRTAHAVRALPTEGLPSALLLDELARGLALWAATFKPLPGRPQLRGSLTLAEAVARLPRPAEPWPIFEAGTFSRIDELTEFPAVLDMLGPPLSAVDGSDSLSALSVQFCRLILAHPEVFAIPLVHTVTPIAAARTLMPYLPAVSIEQLYAQLWKVGAAITVAFTPAQSEHTTQPSADPGTPDELLAIATAHQDPHVLKFSEACAREYSLNPDPAYLLAARHVAGQVPAW
jgi:hypothetical protein